ncbi:DMT family transporter [Paenibacillus polygoni]|uniref:DMT family transporter n=1 Tax=Paenibacillus polygoni TaxID=3050112 RepID=A0ABY8X285_9BACL|nr:DMT family transporter [Paenibacillus polygoni]WIV18368.1 DMT family transporter [Paenibacillus polygoni]
MQSERRSFSKYELLYIIGIVAISFSSIFVKWSEAEVSVVAMYRLFLTNLLMTPLLYKYRHDIFRLSKKDWLTLGISGIMLGLHFLLWMSSLRLTTVASSTVILTLEPILVMLGSMWIFAAKPNRMMLIGMGMAVAGSVIIGAGDFQVSGHALKGDFLSLLGTIAVAIHMIIGQYARKNISAFVYNFWVFLFAGSSLAVYNAGNQIPFTGYDAREWGIFLLLAIVPTLLGHYLFNWLLKVMNATTVSMSVLGEPVIASLLAWVLLGEALTILQLIAGVIILAGVWFFLRYGSEPLDAETIPLVEAVDPLNTISPIPQTKG